MQAAKGFALDCLLPLMESKGVRLSPQEFHQMVNLAFHAFESRVYDESHQDMSKSLPRQMELLSSDLLTRGAKIPDSLTALDIGCGTGLGSELLLQTELGKKVSSIDLVDTSPEMLDKCASRASAWSVDHRLIEGTIETLTSGNYDLVLTCSVLHHIPDLSRLTARIRNLQHQAGIFLHLQDPNGDYLRDSELLGRTEEVTHATQERIPFWVRRLSPMRVAARLRREFAGTQPKPYIDLVNERLLSTGVILRPMTAEEIWSVTDIHEDGLPYSVGEGISVEQLGDGLVDYNLVSFRSYGFFGRLWSELPPAFKAREENLIAENALNGRYLGCVWQRSASQP